ncbi:hypothetical protein CDA63_16275 [Hymenobacter amundsenii]|uniref:Iron dicitrate transport regulator FecR n=1 Tax=Hymenobacter amundsenii TaxID=2006685 RepID=A0A246FHP7_9BACT|nr:FecR domain-containing protein [Hymenobacter amundsenii]OWP62057.1 hypothetical protein CDA63_16275 [Hymenobacter amundsenii]
MNQTEFHNLLTRYQRGECTPAEGRLLEQWYDLLGHDRPPLDLTPSEQEAMQAGLWQRIADRTLYAEDLSPPAGRPWYAGGAGHWAAAAAVALGLGLGWHYWPVAPGGTASPMPRSASGWQTYANTTAAPYTVRLPDGSRVDVAPGGELKYPRRFARANRTVYLRGQAFFSVAPDKAHPFRVYTPRVVTTVLGTSFLVRAPAHGGPVVVKVRTGRVLVQARVVDPAATPAPQTMVVLPNQQAVYRPEQQVLARELVAEPMQVAAQSFEFDDRPVAEVLAALEKAYGVRIGYEAAAVAGCTVTLSLRETSLYAKLDVLCKTLGARYEKTADQILFHGPGCGTR